MNEFDYKFDPVEIEQESFRQIKELVNLDVYGLDEQQVVMRIVHSIGIPGVAEKVRFSKGATNAGRQALNGAHKILCDVQMVAQGVTKRMIDEPPLCFLGHDETVRLAKLNGETRSMAALALWQPVLEGSVVLIGNAPTALFRLIEMLKDGCPKPALIIGAPVGFVGAAESKQLLWDMHEELGVECITLLGREGGSAITTAACNALLRCNRNEYY